jgi:hypothetical protein
MLPGNRTRQCSFLYNEGVAMTSQQEYWEAIQAKVCVKCLDGDGSGNCRIASDGFCALQAYFPKILEVVNSVYSHSIVPYEELLREKVCGACTQQSLSGQCSIRNDSECALDRYFPLIVEVVEETQKRAHLAATRWTL